MAEKIITLSRPNFLASEVGLRTITYTFSQSFSDVLVENGRKIIKGGTIYPSNDAQALGIVFQDVDVTDGDKAEALMVGGVYLSDKLSEVVSSPALAVFQAQGLFAQETPTISVPDDGLLG